MNQIYLERHDTAKNRHRFYHLFVTPSLFDDWSLIREWRRIGSPGTVRKSWYATEQEAEAARLKISLEKLKKGYRVRGLRQSK